MDKVMNLHDKSIGFKDNLKDFKPTSLYRGHVVIVDNESGETILEKDNLVVLRGRAFALEKMFDVNVNEDNESNELKKLGFKQGNINTKKICLWKVGNGGCYEGNLFSPIPVDTDCIALGNEIPFRAEYNNDSNVRLEGYYGEKSTKEFDGRTYTEYYAKTFDGMEWVTNSTSSGKIDEVALKITLTITENDFKTTPVYDVNNEPSFERSKKASFINEIALCIANPVGNDTINKMDDIEIATRLTFESEPYFSSLKSATIYYYIYA